MRSSELKDARTTATGHRGASYEMEITNAAGNLETRGVAIAEMERVKWNDQFWRTYLICSQGSPPCCWSTSSPRIPSSGSGCRRTSRRTARTNGTAPLFPGTIPTRTRTKAPQRIRPSPAWIGYLPSGPRSSLARRQPRCSAHTDPARALGLSNDRQM